MNILTINPGSGTLGYKLIAMPAEQLLKGENIDHVRGEGTIEAAKKAVTACLPLGVDAIGYRVVHGGLRFDRPERITPAVLDAIRSLGDLSPLHNPIDLAIIEAVSGLAPGVPGVAVFDTAFHRTMPEVAWRYALPDELWGESEFRRFGFHGIAYQYAVDRLLECLGREAEGMRLILCHIGGGASVAAVRDGRSVDTSMGMTPLGGLVMSTRCGDLDPGLVLDLARRKKMPVDRIQELLYKKSGLLGLSGLSGDIRDLEPAADVGNHRAALALDIQADRIRKYIGAYAATLGGVDAIALSGALAENSPRLRAKILAGLEFLGVRIDPVRNQASTPDCSCMISTDGATVPVWMIPADEGLQIAREVSRLLISA